MPRVAIGRIFALTRPCHNALIRTSLLSRSATPVSQSEHRCFGTSLGKAQPYHGNGLKISARQKFKPLAKHSFRYAQCRPESTARAAQKNRSTPPQEQDNSADAAAAKAAEQHFLATAHVQQPSISRALLYFTAFTLVAFSAAAYSSLTETANIADKLRDQSLLKSLAARFLQGGPPEQWLDNFSRNYDSDHDFWGSGISEGRLVRMKQLLRAREAGEALQWLNDRESLPKSIKLPLMQAYEALVNKVLNTSVSHQMVMPVIFVNTLIFLAWTRGAWSSKLLNFLHTNFTHRPSSGLTHTLLTSTFSHQAPWHFIFNNFALWTFGGATVYKAMHDAKIKENIPEAWPVPHFIAFFAVAGVFAAMTSHIANALRFKQAVQRAGLLEAKRTVGRTASLGSSGAIWSVIAMTACTDPDSQISLIILPFLPFSIKYGVFGLLAIDVVGVIRGWKMFDHIAHLGGAAFGFFYYQYGVTAWVTTKQLVARALRVGRYRTVT